MSEPVVVFADAPDDFENWHQSHELKGCYFVERSRRLHRVGPCNHRGSSVHAVYVANSVVALRRRATAEGFSLTDCRDCASRGLHDVAKARAWVARGSFTTRAASAQPRSTRIEDVAGEEAFLLLLSGKPDCWATAEQDFSSIARGDRPEITWWVAAQAIASRKSPSTNLHSVSVSALIKLSKTVAEPDRIPRRASPSPDDHP